MTVSLVILTFNRQDTVKRALSANLASAGYPVHELIHVDNGSFPGFAEWFKDEFKPSTQIIHSQNQGVAKGYNRGMLLATSSHIVLTGCDRILPRQWLKKCVEAADKIPNTGAISIYTPPRVRENSLKLRDRERGEFQIINGVGITPSFMCEARFHSREFLYKLGFMREDFGLYGYEDCEYGDRAEIVAAQEGLINYTIPSMGLATELPDSDWFPSISGDMHGLSYRDFKRIQNDDPRRLEVWNKAREAGYPYYNPYSRFEVNF